MTPPLHSLYSIYKSLNLIFSSHNLQSKFNTKKGAYAPFFTLDIYISSIREE